MPDPQTLMRRHGAPAPVALAMQTEIRSGGGLFFTVLQAPSWSAGHTAPAFMQWSCKLRTQELHDLWLFLRQPDSKTGLEPQAAIDQALRSPRMRIGNLLGVFVDEGRPPHTVRVMIGLEPQRLIDEKQLNLDMNKIFQFAVAGAADPAFDDFRHPAIPADESAVLHQASVALRYFRKTWMEGDDLFEPRSMLLSQFDLGSQVAPDTSPFSL
jgi:hypothetical protein